MNYSDWIKKNVPNSFGTCREATKDMQKEFPHLRRVRGHYCCPLWGERGHWWLEDEQRNVIDPTRNQFPSKGLGEYIEWNDDNPEPTGRCINCGSYCYDGETVCCTGCHDEFMDSLGPNDAHDPRWDI